MGVISVLNLVDSLPNPATAAAPGAQDQQPVATQQAANAVVANTAAPAPQDQFVASAQNPATQASAEAAGLFTVTQAAASTPAAGTTSAATSAVAANPETANATTSAVTGAAAIEIQLQTLNNSLQGLGLNAAEIDQIDQVASLSNNFDPYAFTNLAYQLLSQAAEAAKQPAATPANTTPNAVTPGGEQIAAQAKAAI